MKQFQCASFHFRFIPSFRLNTFVKLSYDEVSENAFTEEIGAKKQCEIFENAQQQ